MNHPSTLAKLLRCSPAEIAAAAARLREGGLVAFPTETVYGLGAVVTCDAALRRIFLAKSRPFTDPLISHVSAPSMAFALWDVDGRAKVVVEALCTAFWPGPLTLVAPARPTVSEVVTGGGGTVGVRMPSDPVALSLIEQCGIPVAAPSANRFGHVSPTTAQHVLDDLGNHDIWVLDGGSCIVGIESTVVRVEADGSLEILRRGAVSCDEMVRLLVSVPEFTGARVVERFSSGKNTEAAPGQLVIHYAPAVPAYLIADESDEGHEHVALARCAVVDFGGKYSSWASRCLAYRDLSPCGDAAQACETVFAMLRELETLLGVEAILLPDLRRESDETLLALADRLRRAAALRTAQVDLSER